MANSGNDMAGQTSRDWRPKFPATLISRVAAAVRRGFSGRVDTQRRLQLLETLQLGGRRQLMLVLCDGQTYLVGAGSDSVHSIAGIREQTIPASVRPSILGDTGYQFQPNSAPLSADQKMGLRH